MANEVIEHSGGQVVSFNMAYKSRILSPPNLISAIRVIIIPFIYWCMKRSSDHLALILIGMALLSDAADGYFARRFRWQSDWGLIIDPLADKLLIGSLAVFLVMFREFPVWMAALIIGRDVAIVGVGIYLFFKPMRLVVPSNRTGKLATAVTSIALLNYLLDMQTYGLWFLWLALCLIIGSSIHYAWNFYLLVKHQPAIMDAKASKTAVPPGSALQQRSGTGT